MLNYTASIFAESGSTLSANMSAIVTGSLQMVGSYCSTLLVDRVGRKVRLFDSSRQKVTKLTWSNDLLVKIMYLNQKIGFLIIEFH